MKMHKPAHSGELLRELWLEPMKLSITATAAHLKVSRKTLSEIVNARASVTSEMAQRLELAFGKSAQSWLGHQAAYDLWQLDAKHQEMGIERLAMLALLGQAAASGRLGRAVLRSVLVCTSVLACQPLAVSLRVTVKRSPSFRAVTMFFTRSSPLVWAV